MLQKPAPNSSSWLQPLDPATISSQGWTIAHSLITHFCSFQKRDWAISRSFALLKRANEQALFLSLFAKEQVSDCSFWHSLQKSKWAIALFSLFSKEQPEEQLLFCSFKKSDKKSNRSFTLSKRAIALSSFKKSERAKLSVGQFSLSKKYLNNKKS